MTSKELLTLIYEFSPEIPRRIIKINEISKIVGQEEGFYDKTEFNLLLYNLEQKGDVSLRKFGNTNIVDVSLTELGKRKAVEG